MKSVLMTSIMVICLGYIPSLAQESYSANTTRRPTLKRVGQNPELGIDYALTAKLKVASRKTTYRVGEMITLDIALLNTSDRKVFFHVLNEPKLQVTDKTGKITDVILSMPVYKAVTPDSYEIVNPKEITNRTYMLLAGCDEAVGSIDWGADITDAEIFEKERFISRGQACLKLSSPGEYTIVAKQSNQFVIVSGRKNIKTAIGTISSPPFSITIID